MKIKSLFLVSFLAAAGLAASPTSNLTLHGLQSDFLKYNDAFFYGGLPKATTVMWADLSQWDDMGRIERRSDGSFVILVDPKYHVALKQAQMTLLHEMCHEKNLLQINIVAGTTKDESEGLEGHGAAFDTCMLNIAQHGAFKDLW